MYIISWVSWSFVIEVYIYTLSQHYPVLLHEHPPALINKQTKPLSSLLAQTTGRVEWVYKECNTLYRMAHAQMKSKWQSVFEKSSSQFEWFKKKKKLVTITIKFTWNIWKYSANTENIQNSLKSRKGARCSDKSMTYLGNLSLSVE